MFGPKQRTQNTQLVGLTPVRRWNHFKPTLALSFLAHRNAEIVLMHIPTETLSFQVFDGGWWMEGSGDDVGGIWYLSVEGGPVLGPCQYLQ